IMYMLCLEIAGFGFLPVASDGKLCYPMGDFSEGWALSDGDFVNFISFAFKKEPLRLQPWRFLLMRS
ncbi:MAG: hypothetical protein LUC47_10350, partial [Clostridiales bacterium]|nr:hypothetical protein [Clostridiales bacterium]